MITHKEYSSFLRDKILNTPPLITSLEPGDFIGFFNNRAKVEDNQSVFLALYKINRDYVEGVNVFKLEIPFQEALIKKSGIPRLQFLNGIMKNRTLSQMSVRRYYIKNMGKYGFRVLNTSDLEKGYNDIH